MLSSWIIIRRIVLFTYLSFLFRIFSSITLDNVQFNFMEIYGGQNEPSFRFLPKIIV